MNSCTSRTGDLANLGGDTDLRDMLVVVEIIFVGLAFVPEIEEQRGKE